MHCCTETRGKQHCEAGGGRIAAEQGFPGVLNSYLTWPEKLVLWIKRWSGREAVKEVQISGFSVSNQSTTTIPKVCAWKPYLDEPLAGLTSAPPSFPLSCILQEFLAIYWCYSCVESFWFVYFHLFLGCPQLIFLLSAIREFIPVLNYCRNLHCSWGISSNTICSLCWYAVFMFAVIKQTARALPQNSCNLGLK